MNEIVSKMSELLLKQSGFTNSAFGPFNRKKERKNRKIYTDWKYRLFLLK